MGPNGAGKSTLSAIIAGNENYEVTEGEIFLDNEDISELAPEERAHKGAGATARSTVPKPRKGRTDERSLTSRTPWRSLPGNGRQHLDRTDAAQAVGCSAAARRL
jgi:ABC-type cobalamin/Fe3+-siderophores transport system ATPase subunit